MRLILGESLLLCKIKHIIDVFEEVFPRKLAQSWDNVGLQLGDPEQDVRRILLCLELTEHIVTEAIERGCDLIIAHHPLIFKPVASITSQDPVGRMLLNLSRAGLGLFVAHTNCDAAPDSIAAHLAQRLALQNTGVLVRTDYSQASKLVVYTPKPDSERVIMALHEAGAGRVGNYDHVSFRSQGTGRFRCGTQSNPAIGEPGSDESVLEERAELIVEDTKLKAVINALYEHHPYEEPAFDVYRLQNDVHGIHDVYGFGCIGELPSAKSLGDFLDELKSAWALPLLRFWGDRGRRIHKVGIINGSGAKHMLDARNAGADVLITGDCSHHDFDGAQRWDMPLIDAGHYETERCVVEVFEKVIKDKFQDLELIQSEFMCSPVDIF